MTPVPFQRPVDSDLREHLAKSFGVFHGDGEVHVKVRFSATAPRYVTESKWHTGQQLIPQKDGSLIAEFDLGHIEEIKRRVQCFGQHAMVLEPVSLRAETQKEIDELRRAYLSLEDPPAFDERPRVKGLCEFRPSTPGCNQRNSSSSPTRVQEYASKPAPFQRCRSSSRP